MKKFAEAIRSDGVPRKIGRLAIVTFVLGVLMSVFAIVSALNVRSELTSAFVEVARLRDEQSSLRELLSRIVDAETGLRGYALTGEEVYLEPFVMAQDTLEATQSRHLTKRSVPPAVYARFDAALETTWRDIAETVVLARRVWPETGEVKSRIARIKVAVDGLREEQSTIDTMLARKLELRRALAGDTVSTLLSALGVLALGLVLLSFAQLRELALQAAAFLRSERASAHEITGLEQAVAQSRNELEWVNRQLSVTLRSAGVQVFTLDSRGNINWVADEHSRLQMLNGVPLCLPDLVHPEDRAGVLSALEAAISRGEDRDVEVRLDPAGEKPLWAKLHFAPQGQDNSTGALGCAFEISELKHREEANFWLMRELSHRSKNLLAIVQSIARQTGRGVLDKEAFLARFSLRLQALAASHDLLVKTDYAGAYLGDLIRSQLIGVDHLIGARILLSGPDLVIRAEAAQNLGMAFHELCANAITHGVLKGGSGAVAISWQLEDTAAGPMLDLDWVESGGTAATQAHPAGFGDTLIRLNLPRSLEGEVSLLHAADGTRCHMRLPWRRLKSEFLPQR